MQEKSCSACKQAKTPESFYKDKSTVSGLSAYCRDCKNAKVTDYTSRNKSKVVSYQKTYRVENKQELLKKANERHHNRCKTDLDYKLRHYLRGRLSNVMRGQKTGSAVRDLGCSIPFLRNYLEARFQHGMTWENYGEWHVDHIYPLSKFDLTNRDEFLRAFHYTNLQPLWAEDNLRKGNRV